MPLLDDEELMYDSGRICDYCDEKQNTIHLSDEVVMLEIVKPSLRGLTMHYANILNAQHTGFMFQPEILHESCWDDIVDQFHEMYPDSPDGIIHVDVVGIRKCTLCCEYIHNDEISGRVRCGQLLPSKREPNNEQSLVFKQRESDREELICGSCIIRLESLYHIWSDVPSINSGCIPGMHARCWRDGGCNSGCRATK